MSSKINLQTCEYACKSSIFQDNQLICSKNSKKTIEETEESTSAIETGESSNSGSVPLPISDLDPGPQK